MPISKIGEKEAKKPLSLARFVNPLEKSIEETFHSRLKTMNRVILVTFSVFFDRHVRSDERPAELEDLGDFVFHPELERIGHRYDYSYPCGKAKLNSSELYEKVLHPASRFFERVPDACSFKFTLGLNSEWESENEEFTVRKCNRRHNNDQVSIN